MGQVYLLHFDKPYKHAHHYIGWAKKKAVDRIDEHRSGSGARLMTVLKNNGIGFQIAKIWKDKQKAFERQLKNKGGAKRICPICKEQQRLQRKLLEEVKESFSDAIKKLERTQKKETKNFNVLSLCHGN